MHSVSSLFLAVSLITLGSFPALADGGPLTRDQAVEIAVASNPTVVAAMAQWRAAQSRKLVALAPEDPELEFEYEELSSPFDLGQFGERNIGISQRIESPVRWWFRWKAASQEAESVRFSIYEVSRHEVRSRTKTLFDRVLADRELRSLAEEGLELAHDFARKARTRFEAGDVARLEVMRAEVQVGLSQNDLSDAISGAEISEARLNAVLGRDPATPIEIAGELSVTPTELDLGALRNMAVARRPDLLGSTQALARAHSSRSGAAASLVPDLSLGISRQTIAGPVARSSFWRTTLGFQIPVWAVFRQRGETGAATSEAQQAEAEHEGLVNKALLEVETSFAAQKSARAKAESFGAGVLALAVSIHETASESYRQGKATYLELLEAQKTLAVVRAEYVEALFAYRSAFAKLERAVGSDLE
jgi:cobalt-zinc-cadmium efflux system outer membrane protein